MDLLDGLTVSTEGRCNHPYHNENGGCGNAACWKYQKKWSDMDATADIIKGLLEIAEENAITFSIDSRFTQRIDWALAFAQRVHSGNIHVNWGTQWRADLMPYGGLKDSGMGKEGPKYAVQEMTELKMVVIH